MGMILLCSIIRLLKNIHLLRCVDPSSLRRTKKYDSFLRISRALHLNVFDQPGETTQKPVLNNPVAGQYRYA